MEDNNIPSVAALQEYYAVRHLDMIHDLGLKSIIWHDPISTFGVNVSKDVIVQVWKGGKSTGEPSLDWVPYFEVSKPACPLPRVDCKLTIKILECYKARLQDFAL